MTRQTKNQPRRVLILSDEPLAAALLALLLEVESYASVFAAPGERPEEAVARTRPLIIVLADFTLTEPRSDLFLARLARARIGVAFFAATNSGELRHWARARGVPWVELPADADTLRRVLSDAAAMTGDRRSGKNRRPRTEVRDDGSLLFLDASGRRWTVLDRRVGERRGAQRRGNERGVPDVAALPADDGPAGQDNGEDPGDYRAFVADDGEERRCPLTAREFDEESPAALARQLEMATIV
jgi:CheY-like chemotaxis protein